MAGASPRPPVRPAALGDYRPPPGVADELMRPDGSIRPVWQPMIDHLTSLTEAQVAESFGRGDQYLRDAGVYYRQYTDSGSDMRDWPLSHIPVMIDEAEWTDLARGLTQRAELLERIMVDLYGPGQLVRDGHLPAQLVARNAEWLRPLVGVHPASGHYLHVLAFEVGRSPDGSWLVLGDRTQAPSGAGFALENRMATSRVFHDLFPEANVRRLAGFFRDFRAALSGLRHDSEGLVAILTPGQHTDTYFEHAYIARYLGLPLLESEDLRAVDGRLMVRTINGLEPVSVLWRRLDSRFADPLELDETSAIGAPGLVSTLRAGSVSMLNALGSGVLEARALMAFLPRICAALTGEALSLPNIATWWCGQPAELAYVRDNLEGMMIAPAMSTGLPFEIDGSTALGGRFRSGARVAVRDWLERRGGDLVGQEAVTLSTTPAMDDGRLVPRPVVVRVFAVRTPEGWRIMPGGYARIGRSEDPMALAMQSGGSVSDVWVVAPEPVRQETLGDGPQAPFRRRTTGRLPARAADNLFWLGRYIERAEAATRITRAYQRRLEDSGAAQMPVLGALEEVMSARDLDPAEPVPQGLVRLFEQSQTCAAKVRDRFSDDGWHALYALNGLARTLVPDVQPGDDAARAMSLLLRRLAGFAGLVNDNMFRSAGWRFMTMGRALERGTQIAELLAVFTDPDAPPGSFDVAVEIGDSTMTHRQRYAAETTRNTVVDLLALDPDNPRSLIHQVEILRDQQARLPRAEATTQMSTVARRILQLYTDLSVATPEEMGTQRLDTVRAQLQEISDLLGARYMS